MACCHLHTSVATVSHVLWSTHLSATSLCSTHLATATSIPTWLWVCPCTVVGLESRCPPALARVDVALLVVDLSLGAFEAGISRDGWTRRHLAYAAACRVPHLVVACNKAETVGAERYAEVVSELRQLLPPQFAAAPVVALSALTGQNLLEPFAPGVAAWYAGPTLLAALAALPRAPRPDADLLRFLVHDAGPPLEPELHEPAVTGRVVTGRLCTGATVWLVPSGLPAEVRRPH